MHVEAPADAVLAHVAWRRRDAKPEAKEIVVIDAATGARVANVARASVTREAGDLVFQPKTAPGDYYVYFLPFLMTGRSNYPTIDYPKPVDWADTEWLARNHLTREGLAGGAWQALPAARVVEIQSSDAFEAFTPMEVIATADETRALLEKHPGEAFLLFPEDRSHPIRMTGDLPKRWVGSRGGRAARRRRAARRVREPAGRALRGGPGSRGRDGRDRGRAREGRPRPRARLRAPLLRHARRRLDGPGLPPRPGGGEGRRPGAVARRAGSGERRGRRLRGDGHGRVRAGSPPKAVRVVLRVSGTPIPAGGDDEPERLSRLRWLDSRLAQDDGLVPPYTPIVAKGRTLSVLGRSVELDASGFPRSMTQPLHAGGDLGRGPAARAPGRGRRRSSSRDRTARASPGRTTGRG